MNKIEFKKKTLLPLFASAAKAKLRVEGLKGGWTDRPTDSPDHRYEFSTASKRREKKKNDRRQPKRCSPPLSGRCALQLCCGSWARAVHITTSTPSDGRTEMFSAVAARRSAALYLHGRSEGGVTLRDDVSEMLILLIGGPAVQSELRPYVQCQTLKPIDFYWSLSAPPGSVPLFVFISSVSWRQGSTRRLLFEGYRYTLRSQF